MEIESSARRHGFVPVETYVDGDGAAQVFEKAEQAGPHFRYHTMAIEISAGKDGPNTAVAGHAVLEQIIPNIRKAGGKPISKSMMLDPHDEYSGVLVFEGANNLSDTKPKYFAVKPGTQDDLTTLLRILGSMKEDGDAYQVGMLEETDRTRVTEHHTHIIVYRSKTGEINFTE